MRAPRRVPFLTLLTLLTGSTFRFGSSDTLTLTSGLTVGGSGGHSSGGACLEGRTGVPANCGMHTGGGGVDCSAASSPLFFVVVFRESFKSRHSRGSPAPSRFEECVCEGRGDCESLAARNGAGGCGTGGGRGRTRALRTYMKKRRDLFRGPGALFCLCPCYVVVRYSTVTFGSPM